MRSSSDDNESSMEDAGSLRFNNPPSDPDSLQQMESSGSMPPQDSERNEDICFNSDPNTLQRVGSSSMLPQETSEDIRFNNRPSSSSMRSQERIGIT